MLEVQLVPCLTDNYAYLIRDPKSGAVGVVDPSEAKPVISALGDRGWKLTHVINTHHHWDHTGGNLELKAAFGARVVGPKADRERIPGADEVYGDGEIFVFGTREARIFDIPGHTRGHIAYWFEQDAALFTGDTLFAMGCGRMFEGTAEQMWSSLSKLTVLPKETRIYCGHEYTEANGRFALSVEPGNEALQRRMQEVKALRAAGKPTIPSTLGQELETNPFLRAGGVARFAERRSAKDSFRG